MSLLPQDFRQHHSKRDPALLIISKIVGDTIRFVFSRMDGWMNKILIITNPFVFLRTTIPPEAVFKYWRRERLKMLDVFEVFVPS